MPTVADANLVYRFEASNNMRDQENVVQEFFKGGVVV